MLRVIVGACPRDVTLAGGAQACNVFWTVGSSATLGASSTLVGTIIASTSISIGDSVTIAGRALARDGAVTLINDTVTAPACAAGSLSLGAPTIAAFNAKLTGVDQSVRTTVGAWSVDDATEFLALLPDTDREAARNVAPRSSASRSGCRHPAHCTPDGQLRRRHYPRRRQRSRADESQGRPRALNAVAALMLGRVATADELDAGAQVVD